MDMEDMDRKIALLKEIEILRASEREMEDEIQRLRPMARLAQIMSMQEGEGQRNFARALKAERKLEGETGVSNAQCPQTKKNRRGDSV